MNKLSLMKHDALFLGVICKYLKISPPMVEHSM